jgi:hypothetical protein
MGKANRVASVLVISALLIVFQTSKVLAQEDASCVFPTVTSGVTFPPGWFPIGLSSETVQPGEDVDLDIDFGGDPCPPFTWSVTGNGFALEEETTDIGANALHSGVTSCGAATITVTDNCSRTATGYVRSTQGQWVGIGSTDHCWPEGSGGGGYLNTHVSQSTRPSGKYRWTFGIIGRGATGDALYGRLINGVCTEASIPLPACRTPVACWSEWPDDEVECTGSNSPCYWSGVSAEQWICQQ